MRFAPVTTGPCATGAGCYQWNPTNAVCRIVKNVPDSPELTMPLRLEVTAAPTPNSPIARFTSSAATASVAMNTDGTLHVWPGGVYFPCQNSVTALSPGTWYRLEFHANVSTGAIDLSLYDDGGILLEGPLSCTAQNLGSANWTQVTIGEGSAFPFADPTITAAINFDDVDIDVGLQPPGNVRWQYLAPISRNYCQPAPTFTGCTYPYQCVAEDPPSDPTTFLSGPATECMFNHNTAERKAIAEPIHATLTWINAEGDPSGATVHLSSAINDYGFFLGQWGIGYQNFFGLNLTDPATGGGWTLNGINGIGGIDNTPYGYYTDGTASVSDVRLIVGYEAPTSTPTAPTPTP